MQELWQSLNALVLRTQRQAAEGNADRRHGIEYIAAGKRCVE